MQLLICLKFSYLKKKKNHYCEKIWAAFPHKCKLPQSHNKLLNIMRVNKKFLMIVSILHCKQEIYKS